MYDIDRKKFGAFVASLRKEKGMTQKDLAAELYISDKAVSKWETGVSLPDVGLLVPLSEVLEVSVTELLQCQRLPQQEVLEPEQVEQLVKTAVTFSENAGMRRTDRTRGLWIFSLCLAAGILETALAWYLGFTRLDTSEPLMIILVLCSLFGLYFLVFAVEKLPRYYDENQISAFSDGPLRMNLPGVRISNRNWPYILRCGRIWSMAMVVGYPALTILMNLLAPAFWGLYEKAFLLVLMLGGLLVPMTVVGRKYQ